MPSLHQLGWTSFFQDQIAGLDNSQLRIARVVEVQRRLSRVAGEFDGWAEVSGRLRHHASAAADLPAVGDWVAVAAAPGAERGVILQRLERRSVISRQAPGRAVNEQVVAANIDTVFVVTTFSQDLSPRRLERYLTTIWESGAVPVVVLNKMDLCDDPPAVTASIRQRLPFVDVLAVSALDANGMTILLPYLRPATTTALMGSSGVGKSTMVNVLIDRDEQRVAAARDEDDKGRHTTTARQLIELPGGALLIDTPGMRELQPWADPTAVGAAFDDIVELADRCQFRDCGHAREPGCAVRAAVTIGALDEERLESYRRLLREAAFEERKRDKSAAAEHKRRWKQIHIAQRAHYKQREQS